MKLAAMKEKIAALAERYPAIRLAYLFGSRVQGRTGPLSDYDFAILTDRDRPTLAFWALLQHELVLLLGTDRIDVIWLPQAPIELQYAIISQGVRLYRQNRAIQVEYEAYVMGRYGDYLPILWAQRAEILRKGRRETGIQRYREALARTERTLKQIRAAQRQAPP